MKNFLGFLIVSVITLLTFEIARAENAYDGGFWEKVFALDTQIERSIGYNSYSITDKIRVEAVAFINNVPLSQLPLLKLELNNQDQDPRFAEKANSVEAKVAIILRYNQLREDEVSGDQNLMKRASDALKIFPYRYLSDQQRSYQFNKAASEDRFDVTPYQWQGLPGV